MPHLFGGSFCDFVGFLGAKIVKRERNLKIFWKSLKRNVTDNFVGNLNKYSRHTQIQTMSYPFKGPVTIVGCFWGEHIVKAENNFKNNSKYDKDR